jgi:hypothetical protein
MSDSRAKGRGPDRRASFGITIILGSAAALVAAYWSGRALRLADTEPLESPLILSVARQVVVGPGGLYGPFGGGNPLVLIHAPLYYRLAAMAAWPMVRAGVAPVTAAMIAGRSLSVIGLLATLGLAYRLARLDGAPRKAGWWTVLVILSAPILSGFPFAVRPDMVGIALQTAGILLVLSALQAERTGAVRLHSAYAAFGLAVCVKQHELGAAAVGTGMLLAAWLRGRLPFRLLVSSLMVGASITLLVLGAEEYATNGRMSRAIVLAAASVGRIHPADWGHVRIVAIAGVGRALGLIALLTAANLTVVGARAGLGLRVFATGGAVLVGLLVGTLTMQVALWTRGSIAESSQRLADQLMNAGLFALGIVSLMLIVILPTCALIGGRSQPGGRLDHALFVFMSAELVLTTALTRISTGAWANYAIEAVVLAGVLTGRALARACDEAPSRRLLVLGAAGVLLATIVHVQEFEDVRRQEQFELTVVFGRVKRPRSEFFFVDRPEQNRADGRLELVYDDWLYPVFESAGLADSRSIWLRRALTSGSIHVVVTTSDNPRIGGIAEPLPRLGFRPALRAGSFFVWTHEPLGAK